MAANSKAGFFSVDRGAFRCAAVGGLNSAIAYLIMARGTGRDNRTTQWSVNAIEKYTGISRPNAAKAVKDLLERGVWIKTRDGNHPIYEAVPGNEIPGGPFTADEKATIAAIRNGKAETCAGALVARGIVQKTEVENPSRRSRTEWAYQLDEALIAALTEPFAVWLPNALVDGAANEVAPIERIRQTRCLPALQLLIELYSVQFLPNYGGVPRDLLEVVFDRTKVGQQGPFVVWGFRSKHSLAAHALFVPFLTGQFTNRDDGTRHDAGMDAVFWPAVHTLTDFGLVERVGMLLEGDDDEAEIIHPYAMRGGEPEERELANIAQEAAMAMLTDGQIARSDHQGYHLVPVQKHIGNATMVEVYRLKYRPHTTATAAWYAQMQQTTAEYRSRYRAMIIERSRANSAA
jgi:hypothetical protein